MGNKAIGSYNEDLIRIKISKISVYFDAIFFSLFFAGACVLAIGCQIRPSCLQE